MAIRIAVLLPVKGGASGGFIKHLMEVVPRWIAAAGVKSVTLIAPEGLLPELMPAGAEIMHVPWDNYRRGCRTMREITEGGNFDVALVATSRPMGIRTVPVVTIVQNVEPIQRAAYKMSPLWRLRKLMLRRETRQACREADRVIAVSDYVKHRLATFAPAERIDVVYHGFDLAEAGRAQSPATSILNRPFLFAAGSLVPYRGYEDALRAMAVLRTRGYALPPLLIAGLGTPLAKAYEKGLRQLAASLGLGDHVMWLGLVAQRHMSWYYENCVAFIQSSRAESFSNIQVEAMGHGAVVISCTQPPMPEILDTAALFYRTGDADELADRIASVLKMPAEQLAGWKAKARQRAQFFSWDVTAEQTLASLKQAIVDSGATRVVCP